MAKQPRTASLSADALSVFCYQLSRAFGEGVALTIGLFLVPWLFYLILGFSSRMQFHGNRYLHE